ncbi:hypothetical protein FRC01_012452, partial [Tulasnella sp. 417]
MDLSETKTCSTKDIESHPILLQKGEVTPLPKTQLAIILFARMAEPIAYAQVLPYLNAMIEETRIAPPDQVGFFSGLIESVAALLQLCTLVYWGSLSDRVGRKPVLLTGLLSISVATICFGQSNKLWQMVLFRGLNAALCGNSPIIGSIMSDIADKTNQHKVFPLAALTWYGGEMIGSLIGGLLSHPAEKYPGLFGFALLRARPFLLPCLASSLITCVAIVATATLLKESHPHFREEETPRGPYLSAPRELKSYAGCQNGDLNGPSPATNAKGGQTLRLLSNATIRYILVARFLRELLSTGFGQVLVLWSYTPLSMGGLQRSPAEIGTMLSFSGVLGAFTTTIVFHYFYRRSNSVTLFAACMAIWGLAFASVPVVSLTIRRILPIPRTYDNAPSMGGLWGLILLVLAFQRLAEISYPASLLMANEAVSDPSSGGALFGLVTTAACLAEGIAPAITS